MLSQHNLSNYIQVLAAFKLNNVYLILLSVWLILKHLKLLI